MTAGEATVAVTLGSDVGDLSAEAFTPDRRRRRPRPPSPVVPAAPGRWCSGRRWFYGGLARARRSGCWSVLLVMLLRARPSRSPAPSWPPPTPSGSAGWAGARTRQPDPALAQATQTAEKVLGANKSLETRIAERLDGAGNPFKPAEWLLLHVGDLHRLRRRSACCSAAATSSSASSSWSSAPSVPGCTSGSSASGGARRSSASCPRPSS